MESDAAHTETPATDAEALTAMRVTLTADMESDTTHTETLATDTEASTAKRVAEPVNR